VKRKWKAEPQTQAEVRDCSVELSGEQLQKINAGPQQINFKTVFVKSSTTKSFIVTNDLRQHIYVRLLVDQYSELQQSSPLSQVIPPGQEAGFDIVFCSKETKTFSAPITYYINDSLSTSSFRPRLTQSCSMFQRKSLDLSSQTRIWI